jgi:ribonuclease D
MSLEQEYLYVNSQSVLDEYCERAQSAPALALDTEFVRTRTLYSKLGLIQVYDGEQVALIDPLSDIDLEPFWQLLTAPNIIKILHSCHEDLEVFKTYAKRLPRPLFDTQIAGQFLFQGKVLGFGAMVEQELGISLDKGEARTNWLKRPLTENQLQYAYNDVKYLLPVYEKLSSQLKERQLLDYCMAEVELKVTQKEQITDSNQLFLNFGNAWQLKPRELAVLQELALWRLKIAEQKDLALGFVAKDATLLALAQRKPADIKSMKNIPGINHHEIRIHGRAMLNIIQQAKEIDIEHCPVKVPRLTDFPKYKQALKVLKQLVMTAAEQYSVPIEMLATKKQMNQFIKWSWQLPYADEPDFNTSWRKPLLEAAIAEWQAKFN